MEKKIISFLVGEDEIRVKLHPYKEFCLLEIRQYEKIKEKDEYVPSYNGFIIPVTFLNELLNALERVKDYLEEKKYEEKAKKMVPEIIISFCDICGSPVKEKSEGIYICDCGETRIVLAPLGKAIEEIFEKVKKIKLFEDFSPG
ncbi:MAG: hypothetical protein ABIM62_02880 [candidate division WOR-3 bacterium]